VTSFLWYDHAQFELLGRFAASITALPKSVHSSSLTLYLFSLESKGKPEARELDRVGMRRRRVEGGGRGVSAKEIRRPEDAEGERGAPSVSVGERRSDFPVPGRASGTGRGRGLPSL